MLGATVPLIEGDEKPLGFGGGKKINTSNIRPYYIHFLSLIQKNPISVSLTLVTVNLPTYLPYYLISQVE